MAIIMTITVFTDADAMYLQPSALLLSVSPIVGGGVASFAYAIATRGTYFDNIYAVVSNRQVVL